MPNKQTERGNNEIIEDLNEHVDVVKSMWQQLLALLVKIDKKAVSTVEVDFEEKEELTPADFLVAAPAITSRWRKAS